MTSTESKRRDKRTWADSNGCGLKKQIKPQQRRISGRFAKSADDASLATLRVKCRHAGLAVSDANIRAVRAQSYEGQAGMAIHAGAKDAAEVNRLWTIFSGLDGAQARYYRHVIGLNRYAKTTKIEMEPAPVETRPDDMPDLRDDDQRARDAASGWARWKEYLAKLAPHQRTVIYDALKHRHDMAQCGRLTFAGRVFIASLRKLADVFERG